MNLNELRAAYREADRMFSDLVPSTTEQISAKLIVALEDESAVLERMLREAYLDYAEDRQEESHPYRSCDVWLADLRARAQEDR